MNNKLSNNILNAIEESGSKPISKSFFRAKNSLLWIPWVTSTLIGSAAISALLFRIQNSGWQYSLYTHQTMWESIYYSLPYVWFILLIIGLIVSIKALRRTNNGYRYGTFTIFLSSIVTSLIVGAILFFTGVGDLIDTKTGSSTFFTSTQEQQAQLWSNPEQGRLGGNVKRITGTTLRIKDFDGYYWLVDMTEVVEHKKTLFNTITDRNKQVRVLGYIDNEYPNLFHACVLAPLLPGRERNLAKVNPRLLSQKCQKSLQK